MLLSDHILYIDAEAIIVDKPAGLPVTMPRSGRLSVENHLDSLRFGFQRMPMIVHRLDQDTSGCLLLARNPKAQKRYSAAFESGIVRKSYLALITGLPDTSAGTITIALGKTSTAADGWRMVPDDAGKSATTHWRMLADVNGQALILFTPETGRTHQLRVHALHGLGYSIIGDPTYGSATGKVPMLLHALSIAIPRPGKPDLAATAPLPDRFVDAGVHADMVPSVSAVEIGHG
jgi:tRNA pseudouridine32 synthase / 23S rRNA pseudouridine746 synthase